MPSDPWVTVVSYADPISAEAAAGYLREEDVPSRVASDEALPGLASSYWVQVPEALLHRAQWLLSQAAVSDAELTLLATGKLSDGSEDK